MTYTVLKLFFLSKCAEISDTNTMTHAFQEPEDCRMHFVNYKVDGISKIRKAKQLLNKVCY